MLSQGCGLVLARYAGVAVASLVPCCLVFRLAAQSPPPHGRPPAPQEFPDPMSDPALRRLVARHYLSGGAQSPAHRVRLPTVAAVQRPPRSVLVQPIHGTNSDRWAPCTARTARVGNH